MTSTALASRYGAAPVIRVRADRRENPPRDIASLLAGLQADTGTAQIGGRPETADSRTLISSWDQVIAAARSRGWHLAAERIFEDVEEGRADVTKADGEFLTLLAAEPGSPAVVANTAIRLLGMLAEDDYLPVSFVFPTLMDLLIHDDTQRRYYAVKALWQARARDALPALRRRLDREESKEVAEVIRRAIAVLG